MAKLAFIAPYPELGALAAAEAAAAQVDLTVRVGSLTEGVRLAREAQAEGAEAIISRGWTSADIARAGLDLPVVEVPFTAFDLLRAWQEARGRGRLVGLADEAPIVRMFGELQACVGWEAVAVTVTGAGQIDRALHTLREQGVDVIVGKVAMVQAADAQGIPGVVLGSGREAVREAIETARQVVAVRRAEQERSQFWRAVLDVTGDGLITVDGAGRITACNPAAVRLLQIPERSLVGRAAAKVLPGLPLDVPLRAGEVRREELVQLQSGRVLVGIHPVLLEGRPAGAVCSLREVAGIQRLERQIRERLAERGHVARYTFADIVGRSEPLTEAITAARRYAQAGAPVLIQGETGTGKEIFAQAIHSGGPRAGGPFVAVNCAALPETLLESELFGYTEGAFTGARKGGKPGLFELAHGGTIFLDEISEMPVRLQSRLLRVLQEGEVMRLGSDRVIPVDVGVVSAANRDLTRLVDLREFRSDLYYRLSVLKLQLPALRERESDIPALAEAFLSDAARRYGRPDLSFTADAVRVLAQHKWPGNIRELRNTVERLVILADGPRIQAPAVRAALDRLPEGGAPAGEAGDTAELERLERLLGSKQINRSRLARELGISRTTLWRRLREADRAGRDES